MNGDVYYYYKRYMIDRIIENCNLTSNNNYNIYNNFSANAIVASPSKTNPDYWYEWVRDSGIVINMLIDLLNNNDVKYRDVKSILESYVKNHLIFQDIAIENTHIKNSETEFTVTMGEPKFNIDLSVYDKSWGRPQNDLLH